MSDQHHRDRAATELDGSFLVEAGAGTGKTTLIVERIVRLFEHGVPMGSIAAITFTEKAAGELKIRLRRAFEEVNAQAALSEVEAAPVSTIHAFCASVLREWPIEAGVDPAFAVMEERERTDLLEVLWATWLNDELTRPNAAVNAALELRLPVEWWVKQFRILAFQLIEHRGAALPAATGRATGDGLLAELEPVIARMDALRANCLDEDDRAARRINKVAAGLSLLRERGATPALLFRRLGTPIGKTIRLGAQRAWLRATLEEVRELLGRSSALIDRAGRHAEHEVLVGLCTWLRGFTRVYEAEKSERGVLDFDDLLLRARNLVRDNERVRTSLTRRFNTLIIDEFQDTDPLQFDLAFLLAGSGGKLFLVGDPKQSIYGFRRADVEMYNRARNLLPETLTISRNFRSAPAIVDWVNDVFPPVMPYYKPLEATREAPEHAGVWRLRPDKLPDKPKAHERRALEASYVAAWVRHVLPTWGVKPQEVAVLFRAMGDAVDAYEDAFKAAGVNYVVAGGKRLYQRQEVRSLRAVCAAVDNPADGAAIAAALRSPFFGASDAALFDYHRRNGRVGYLRRPDDADPSLVAEAMRRLLSWHEARAHVRPHQLLERILEETGALAAFALKPDGDRRIANLLRLVEEARRVRGTFRTFVRWLATRIDQVREEGESPILDPHDPAVRFLTIHKSKGLEFPVVVLADLAYQPTDKDLCFMDRREGRLEVRLAGGAGHAGMQTLTYEGAKEASAERSAEEELRVFYVAATRARDALVLPVFADKGGLLPVIDGRGTTREIDITTMPRPSGPVPTFKIPADRLLTAPAAAPEPFVFPVAQPSRRVVSVTELVATRRYTGGKSGGAEVGSLVHHCLHTGVPPEQEAHARGLDRALAQRADRLVRSAGQLDVTSRAASAQRSLRELPFVFRIGDTLVEGSIDLAFEVSENEWTIVDYKTDAGTDHADRLDKYTMQCSLYALAITELTGGTVREAVLAFLDSGVEHAVQINAERLAAARRLVEAWQRPAAHGSQLSLFA